MWSVPGGIGSPTSAGAYGSSKADSSIAAEPCRFFLNGGCLRGDACPYSHEFPDDRHLDVNNVGFIFTSGVQNSATALQRRYNQQASASSASSPQPAGPQSASQAAQQPPAYHHGARTHQSPQPQPTPLTRGSTVGSVTAQPFIPQSFSQQTPIATPAPQQAQYSAAPAGPTSSIYTYGSVGAPVSIISPHAGASSSIAAPHLLGPQGVFAPQQTAMHVTHAPTAQPQYAPQAYLATSPLQANVTLLQPPLRGSSIGAVPIAPRTDPGPYAPPPALPYALPPTMTIAYQYVGIPAGLSETGYGAYNQSTQQAALMATLIPVAATSA